MAEALNGTYKAELIRRHGPWRTRSAAEFATIEWIDWSRYAGDPPAVRAAGSAWVMWPSCRAWSAPIEAVVVA